MGERSNGSAEVPGAVVELSAVRERRRLGRYGERARLVLADNRRALERLFGTGLAFSRHGSRAGRDLLLAHQHLLRVGDLVAQEQRAGLNGRSSGDLAAVLEEIEALLEKSSVIARRNKSLFQNAPAS